MTEQIVTLNNVQVTLAARTVLTLLQLAGRAPLLDAERLWLEGTDREIGRVVAGALQQPPPLESGPNPPKVTPARLLSAAEQHGVNSPEAEAMRQARREQREADEVEVEPEARPEPRPVNPKKTRR